MGKVRDSDDVNSSTSSSTKKSRHTSLSSEDTKYDDVSDNDRLSVKVKHNRYADPPLENPLQTLNKAVTWCNEEQPKQQQVVQVQTVEEDDVSELFADIVEDTELGPPIAATSSRPCIMFSKLIWFQKISSCKTSKRYKIYPENIC